MMGLYIQMNDNIPILKKNLSTCSHCVTSAHSMLPNIRKIILAYN